MTFVMLIKKLKNSKKSSVLPQNTFLKRSYSRENYNYWLGSNKAIFQEKFI